MARAKAEALARTALLCNRMQANAYAQGARAGHGAKLGYWAGDRSAESMQNVCLSPPVRTDPTCRDRSVDARSGCSVRVRISEDPAT